VEQHFAEAVKNIKGLEKKIGHRKGKKKGE